MNAKPIIRLSALQVAEVYLDRLVNFFQSGVTPEEALAKTLQSLANDIAEQRELTQAAMSEITKYQHPKTGAGILKDKRERLQRYIDEGVRDQEEEDALKLVQNPSRAQKARLIAVADELTKDASNVNALQSSIQTDESNLVRWQERYNERLAKLKELKANFEALQSEGKALIAQIRDAQRAEQARKEDENSHLGQGTNQNAKNMLENLRDQADAAARMEDADDLVDEALQGEPSLDDELAARQATNNINETIAMFRAKARKVNQ